MLDTTWDPLAVPREELHTTEEVLLMLEQFRTADHLIPGIHGYGDTETEVHEGHSLDRDGIGAWAAASFSGQFSGPLGTFRKAWVINMTHVDTDRLKHAFQGLRFAAWNANFEDEVFLRAGIDVDWVDPMLWLALLDLGRATLERAFYTGLADAVMRFGGIRLFGKGGIQKSFRRDTVFTDDQNLYAMQDATSLQWVAPLIWNALLHAALTEVAAINDGARRFIDWMRREGLYFDAEGWRSHLKECEARRDEALMKLRDLTDGGELTLFGNTDGPRWNPAADDDIRKALNQWASADVRAYLQAEVGEGRLLDAADKVDGDALKLMGGELAAALLEWKSAVKTLSTYGESILELLHDDGKFHAKYWQALTATGRLNSEKPNAQNLDPAMKKYLKPSKPWRVFICADYSQAELRYLTVQAKDEGMRSAYEAGIDIHEDTAAKMFSVDMAELRRIKSPDYKMYRSKAKPINFGIGYGMSGKTLARNMTVDGIPTTGDEGDALLNRWLEIRPGVKEFLFGRDAVIENMAKSVAKNPGAFDWSATWQLHQHFPAVNGKFKELRKANGIAPTAAEVAEALSNEHTVRAELSRVIGRNPTEAELQEEMSAREAVVAWILSFKAPVVLLANGTPVQWESRTAAGSRRVWNVKTEDWVWAMVQIIALSKQPGAIAIRDAWAAANGLTLAKNGKPLSRAALKKAFDGKNKKLRNSFVEYVTAKMPQDKLELASKGLQDCIRAKRNEYRNHPIQGGVGVIVLAAMADLTKVLKEQFPTAAPVQSVHDSLVLECDVWDALALGQAVKKVMEDCFTRYCAGVAAQADVDTQTSLYDGDTITDEQIQELIREYTERMPVAA
jgi:hypothetical protein